MTAGSKVKNLKVVLGLKWIKGNDYEAKVTVTVTDSCYHPGELKVGLPPGTVGLPEIEYMYFNMTHDEGKACGDITKNVEKTIHVPFSSVKPNATAYVVVNSAVAGSDTKPFPRS
jgi:hypothetical protein